MRIRYFCFWSALSGFGRAARDYVACLTRAGHEVEVIDWTSIPGSARASERATAPESRYRDLDRLVVPWPARVDDGALEIYHAQPRLLARLVEEGAFPKGHQRHTAVAVTAWETSTFPEAFVAALEANGRDNPVPGYATIIAPSEWCADVIADSGIDCGVRVVPHTFDPEVWPETPWATGMPQPLTFYAMGAWSERKNHQAIIRAYLHAFEPNDHVRLAILSHNADKGAIRSLMARSGIPLGFPEITVDHRQYDDIVGMHAAGEVFVSASRGEGWGLPCFEAAVLGKTIISPLCSGEAMYLHDYAGLRVVGHASTPCFAGSNGPVIRDNAVVGEKIDHVPGMTCRDTWAEPFVRDIADRMRTCYEQYRQGIVYSGAPSRASLVARFGYDVVAQRLTTTLEEISR